MPLTFPSRCAVSAISGDTAISARVDEELYVPTSVVDGRKEVDRAGAREALACRTREIKAEENLII